MFDPARVAAINAVNNHNANPAGNTSVGDGVDRARQILDAVPTGDYQHKAMIVLTDGLENQPLLLADVPPGTIDARTFAIGLGNEHQVNTTALRTLANGTGGFLYLTGLLSASIDDYFRLSKFFLQILAGVTNTDIIRDPSGFIGPGMKVRVPFHVTEADIECTPVLMTDESVVDLMLETPDGSLINPPMAPALGMTYAVGAQTRHYRFTLPLGLGAGQRQGLWHVLLEVNSNDYKKVLTQMRERKDERFQTFATHGARYSVVVQAYSNLRMNAAVQQSGFTPGADLLLRVNLAEYGIPVERRARVEVEMARPGGSVVTLPMGEVEPGTFEVTTRATRAGIHHLRFVATGATLRGTAFTREQVATAAVWQGGDDVYQPPRDVGGVSWCRLLECLVGDKTLSREARERLKKIGVDLDGIRGCLKQHCAAKGRAREPR